MTAVAGAVHLGATGIETTRLAFGCADLFRIPDGTRRQRLLDAALDAGISHFDVAPMYGLGRGEAELGHFARGKRHRIVIATKFGIEPTVAAQVLGRIQGPIRRAAALIGSNGRRVRTPGMDPRLGTTGRLLYAGGDYGPETGRASLERSLRALQTDHVDLLFLHDPMPGAVKSDDVRAFLEQARAAGRIRAWGVAGERLPSVEAAQRFGTPLPVLQVRGDVFSRPAAPIPDGSSDAVILFGAIGRALPRILERVRADAAERRQWSDAVGCDCGSADAVASLLLADALAASGNGPVIFSSTRVDRIEHAAAIRESPVDLRRVEALRSLVRALAATDVGP